MRTRRVGERIALFDRDPHCAALENGEQICGAFQHFAAGVQIVRKPGTGHIERAHAVETEQIEWRDQPTCGPIRHTQTAAAQTGERGLKRAAADTVVNDWEPLAARKSPPARHKDSLRVDDPIFAPMYPA